MTRVQNKDYVDTMYQESRKQRRMKKSTPAPTEQFKLEAAAVAKAQSCPCLRLPRALSQLICLCTWLSESSVTVDETHGSGHDGRPSYVCIRRESDVRFLLVAAAAAASHRKGGTR